MEARSLVPVGSGFLNPATGPISLLPFLAYLAVVGVWLDPARV